MRRIGMEKKFMKKRPTLRVSIITSLIILISISNLGIIGLIYYYSQELIGHFINNSIKHVEKRVEVKTENYFKPCIKEILFYKKAFEKSLLDPDNLSRLETLMYHTLSSSKSIEILNFGLEDGSFIMLKRISDGSLHTKLIQNGKRIWHIRKPGSEKVIKIKPITGRKYDPRVRPWYQGAKKNNSPFWTDVYIFWSDQQPGITVSVPIVINGIIKGVFAADIGLNRLSNFLKELYVSKNGKAVITASDNTLIASPWGIKVSKNNKGKLVLKNLVNYNKEILSKLESKIKVNNREKRRHNFTLGGDKYSLNIIPLKYPPGTAQISPKTGTFRL